MNDSLLRLNKSIEYLMDKGAIHKQQDIADRLAMEKGNLSRALKGNPRYLTEGFLRRFATAYADHISADWLIDGTGEMERADPKNFRPYVSEDGRFEESLKSDIVLPLIKVFPDYDFSMKVKDNSMFPRLHAGDIVCCSWLKDLSSIIDNKMYVIESSAGTIIRCVEKIYPNNPNITDPEESISLYCTALNNMFPPFLISLSSIRKMADVVGMYTVLDYDCKRVIL